MSYRHVFGNILHILVNIAGFREKYQKPWITGLTPLPNTVFIICIQFLSLLQAVPFTYGVEFLLQQNRNGKD